MNLRSKLEDLAFDILQKLPEQLIPAFAINWMSDYVDARTRELQHQIVQAKWNKAERQQLLKELQSKEAPTED